ncbi:MAG TPA: hypothetical protein VF190_01845, partial [Rhodothermales bacterium]
PELTAIGGKLPKEGLYEAVLYPSAGISHGYEGRLVTTKDGARLVGIVQSETVEGIVLRMAGGLTRTLRSDEIAASEELTESLMPPVGRTLSQKELIDLIEFLSSLKGAEDGAK